MNYSYEECLKAVRNKFHHPVIQSFEYDGDYIFSVSPEKVWHGEAFTDLPTYRVNGKTLKIEAFSIKNMLFTGNVDLYKKIISTGKHVDQPT